jgi:hypothetical protein
MIQAHLKELLERCGVFPPAAELTVREGPGDAIRISCSWLLENDPEQPDKRSTPIKILLHGRAADLFRNANHTMLKQLDEALVRLLARRMKRYRADHGLPYRRLPPPFEIRIDAVDLG